MHSCEASTSKNKKTKGKEKDLAFSACVYLGYSSILFGVARTRRNKMSRARPSSRIALKTQKKQFSSLSANNTAFNTSQDALDRQGPVQKVDKFTRPATIVSCVGKCRKNRHIALDTRAC